MKYRLLEDRFEHTANTIVYDPAGWREIMNRAIDDLIESARLFGGTQAKRGFGVYTQDDAIMEHSFWEGVEARAKAIRDEVAAIKAEQDASPATQKTSEYLGDEKAVTCSAAVYSTVPINRWAARVRAAIAKTEGSKE